MCALLREVRGRLGVDVLEPRQLQPHRPERRVVEVETDRQRQPELELEVIELVEVALDTRAAPAASAAPLAK